MPGRHALVLLAAALLCPAAFAQTEKVEGARPPAPPVTISTTGAGVRFAALGQVGQSRVEVYDASGRPVLDTGFLAGNVRDWDLKDSHGAALADGSYTCVVTVRELSGRLSFKQGVLAVNGGRAAVAMGEAAQSEVEVDEGKSLTATRTQESEPSAMTLTAHDGRAGQVVSTRGALSFRLGDFFAGKDREAMRLTEKGLTVAGALRAKGGILFDDGTALTSAGRAARASAGGGAEPYAAGTGTANRLAKWAETGGDGTLTNSAVTEVSGSVGIGTPSPRQTLHVLGKGFFQTAGTASLVITDRTDGMIAAVGAGGLSSTLAYDEKGIFKIESNERANIIQGFFGADRGATTRLMIDESGNVGIGTTSPVSELNLRRDAANQLGPILTLTNGGGFEGAGAALDFATFDSGTSPASARVLATEADNFAARLTFWTKSPGGAANPLVERMRVGETGDVTVMTAGQGLILKAPNGTVCTRLTINNVGALSTNTLPCP